MVMAGMFEWHRNKQYIVISEFVITGVWYPCNFQFIDADHVYVLALDVLCVNQYCYSQMNQNETYNKLISYFFF